MNRDNLICEDCKGKVVTVCTGMAVNWDTPDWMHFAKCLDCSTNYVYNGTKDILKKSDYQPNKGDTNV